MKKSDAQTQPRRQQWEVEMYELPHPNPPYLVEYRTSRQGRFRIRQPTMMAETILYEVLKLTGKCAS